MQADLTRITFDPDFDFTAVVQQQGRCEVEADWNEEDRIHTWAMRRLAEDLIGPHGGPIGHVGFKINPDDDAATDNCEEGDFAIGKGVYYVRGIRVVNHETVLYTGQPGRQPDLERCNPDHVYLVYLEVWERHVTYIEEPQIREVALLGPDTCTRLQLVWQVMVCEIQEQGTQAKATDKKIKKLPTKVKEIVPAEPLPWDKTVDGYHELLMRAKDRAERDLHDCVHRRAPMLEARVKAGEVPDDPCVQSPSARYRGLENQLYRIEIHKAGEHPTFKWSRENGSVIFPVLEWKEIEAEHLVEVDLENLGRDERYGLQPNDIVEVVDDVVDLTHQATSLLTVLRVDALTRRVTLTGQLNVPLRKGRHPFLRRWDHRARDYKNLRHGAIPYEEDRWFDIEDGIQIRFERRQAAPMTGDYWVIPARTVTGDIEWPPGRHQPTRYRLPRGIERAYAPLAYIKFGPNTTDTIDVRRRFDALAR